MKGKVILLVIAIVAIVLTIALYNAVVSYWTSMIQLSLVIVCASELAIVGTMGLLPIMNYKNGSTGIMINVYAGLMILWSLIGCNFGGNTYLTGLLIISFIMLIIIGMTVLGGHETDRLNNEVEETISNKRSFASAPAKTVPSAATPQQGQENLSSMWLTIQSTVDDFETRNRLRVLKERIQAMPANRFPNPTIESSMTQLTAMCRALSNEEAHDRILERINQKAKELSNYIKTL